MCVLSKELPAKGFTAQTREDPHGHAALCLSVLSEDVYATGQDDCAHQATHR